jgi:methionyl aminopeptidase
MIIYVKSQEEIEGFKEAGRIAGNILKKLISNIKIGVTTKQLDELAREECKKHNVIPTFLDYRDFPAAICASVNNVLVHGFPNDNPIKDGDIVSIDFGATLDGFIGDTADTKVMSSDDNMLVLNCAELLYSGISKARAGNKLSDISKAIYNNAKYSIPTEFGGHGIDRNTLHSDPFVPNIPDDEEDCHLQPGMIFAIEPMLIDGPDKIKVADNGWDIVAEGNTAHCEHTILITEDEPFILTEAREK